MDSYPKNKINYSNFNNNSELDITDTHDNIDNFGNTDREEIKVVNFYDLNSKQLADCCATWSFMPSDSITVNSMFGMIEDCILNYGFEIIERQPYEAIAIRNQSKGIIDVMKLCVPCISKNSKHTSFKFVIHENQDGRVSKVDFKCLVGSTKTVNEFFENFKKQIEKKEGISGKSEFVKNKKSEYLKGTSNTNKDNSYRQISIIDTYDESGAAIEMESNKIVHINKQLANKKYGIGKLVAEFVENFKQECKSKNVDLKKMMGNLVSFVNTIKVELGSEGNLGGATMKKYLPLAKYLSEKFILDLIYDDFFGIYKKQFYDRDLLFKAKTHIMRKKPAINVMKDLDVKEKFIQIDHEATDEEKKTFIPFSNSIFEINKLSHCKSPKEKLDCVTMMSSQMRSEILQYHNMDLEQQSMDDELPITIYILSFTDIAEMISNLNYVINYTQVHDFMDNESKMLVHIKASTDYILDNWNIESIPDN